MASACRYTCVLIWISFLYIVGILFFLRGFLLKRSIIPMKSSCNERPVEFLDKANSYQNLAGNKQTCWLPNSYSRAVVIVIDGLRYDFARWDEKSEEPTPYYLNKLPVIRDTLFRRPHHGRLFKFMADPPTTTMQRLKGLTTGSLPTFIDAGQNFASYEITEDNIIDQLVSSGKRVVFLGDDTWEGLFPKRFHLFYPFPSFNVKDLDTVDNGIMDHLVPIMKSSNWDVIIAHFLGVDHCGHAYGPNHPTMAQKLRQMDQMIQLVINSLGNDTVLFVMGDHGMTRTGDHGGDSVDEVSSALFVYGSAPFPQSTPKAAVQQVDFVPTISLLLGIPIPFASLGSIIDDLVGATENSYSSERVALSDLRAQCEALWVNVFQVSRYLAEYTNSSNEFSPQLWEKVQQLLDEVQLASKGVNDSSDALSATHNLKRLKRKCEEFLLLARNMCQEAWATFNVILMMCGLAQIVVAVLLGIWLSSTVNDIISLPVSVFTLSVSVLGFFLISVLLFYLDNASLTGLTVFFIIGACSFGSCLIITICKLRPSNLWKLMDRRSIFTSFVLLVYAGSLFSNSYILTEVSVIGNLIQVLLWSWFVLPAAQPPTTQTVRRPGKPEKKKETSSVQPNWLLLLIVVVFGVVLRLSYIFRKCPEDQLWCEEYNLLRPLSALHGNAASQKNWRYLLSAMSGSLVPFILCRWLSHTGNLNGFFATLFAKYLPGAATMCTCFYWGLSALPQNLFNRLQPWQQVWAPRAVFILLAVIICLFMYQPLCIYHQPNVESIGPIFSGESAELIPKVFNHLKLNWKQHQDSSNAEPSIVVYGLATVYSAGQIVVVSAALLLVMVLLSDGVAPSLVLLLLSAFLLLFALAAVKSHSASEIGELFKVPWTFLAAWSLCSSFFFFTTGHQTALSAIQWNSAFVGSGSNMESHVLLASKVLLNTFASQVIFSLAVPLLMIWPLTCSILLPGFLFQEQLKDTVSRGEFTLYKREDNFFLGLFRCIVAYITLQGIKILACAGSAALHRRHLMVWKLFGPRLIFESASTGMTLLFTILGFLVVVRIHSSLVQWMKKVDQNS